MRKEALDIIHDMQRFDADHKGYQAVTDFTAEEIAYAEEAADAKRFYAEMSDSYSTECREKANIERVMAWIKSHKA